MSRLERLLLALLAVLLAAVILLGALLWIGQNGVSPLAVSVDARQMEDSSAAPDTAKGAFVLAQRQAASWAPDATLLNARGNWPAGEFEPAAGSWAFVFYSPGQAATALVTVGAGGARLLTTGPADRPLAPAGSDLWQVDSPQVIATVLANGGEEFIASHNRVSMRLSLSATDVVAWTATLVDETSRETFTVMIEAVNGGILSQDSDGTQ